MKHPIIHNNHPNKVVLELMVQMLQPRTQTTTLHNVKVHNYIKGNEQVDTPAK